MTRAATAIALALLVVTVPTAYGTRELASATTGATAVAAGPSASWTDGDGPVASLALVSGRVRLGKAADRLDIKLTHALFVSIPEACETSPVVRIRSFFDDGHLVCEVVKGVTSVRFSAIVVGKNLDRLGGRVAISSGADTNTTNLPDRLIVGGTPALNPDLRLLSSPDFLNGDVGDLRKGPNFWNPRRSANSTNAQYEEALDVVLDDWASLDPAGVLVAGDLVNGRWGYDDLGTGNFGPVRTGAQQRAAVRRAARTYYPQWSQRFTSRGLAAFPTIGDHEYGDDPWPKRKRLLARTFRKEFARQFTLRGGEPIFPDHPTGQAANTAYAGRPTPDVQVISLDVFDITPKRARIGLDPHQFEWLSGVLAKAKSDGVPWIIVQGHVPIVFPVAARASSKLHYPGGTDSRLWKLMRQYDVDVYLSGEVHDTTALERDGIVQVSHGGIFQFGLTTALVMDFYGNALYLTLRDYDVSHSDGRSGSRLWETRRAGLPRNINVSAVPMTIGTAIVQNGALGSPSGILIPR